MLSHGGFTQCNSLIQSPISKSLVFPTKPHLFFVLNQVQLSHHKLPSLHGRIRTGLCAFASKTSKKFGKTLLQVEELEDDDDVDEIEDDDEYDEDQESEEEEEEEEEEKDEDDYISAAEYKALLISSYSPKGFGEDKNSPQSPNSKKDSTLKLKAKKAPSGVSVRLTNLPKKKNIDRDLRAAFKEFPGILKIVPVVSNSGKTREPSCKGIASVYFKSQDEANRFVQLFSEQIITFGKVQKKINYEIKILSSPNTAVKQEVNKNILPLLPVDPSSEDLNPQLATNSEYAIGENVSKTRVYTGILDNFTSLESIDIAADKLDEESATDMYPLENQKENEVKGDILRS